MEEIIPRVLNWAVPFLCGGIITALCVMWKFIHALCAGVQCLLRAEIIRMHDKYTERKYCPIYAKESLRRAYQAYHGLHGNDVATALYDETMALPTDPPDGKGD
jgi:hypothetical protein